MRNVVDRIFERRVAGLVNTGGRAVLRGGRKGVEKESLRVRADGRIAQTRHPAALGAPLTNEHITTDFSESLFELVTLLSRILGAAAVPVRHPSVRLPSSEQELLWSTSMPCAIDAAMRAFPFAQFGSSNVGRMKTIATGSECGTGASCRRSWGAFQHSFPADLWDALEAINRSRFARTRSAQYFGVLRNYRRFGWLVLYLFGTSPAVFRSFFAGRDSDLPMLDDDTFYEPYGTSLRMSDIGYRNRNQATVNVSVNGLDEYVRDL